MSKIWKKVESKVVYQNQWISIREDKVIRPDGLEGIYGYLEKRSGVFIIAQNDKSNIYLIKEHRYPVDEVVIQIPAGVIDKEDEAVIAARRELKEETGIVATTCEYLGMFYVAPAHETTTVYVYLAKDLDTSNMQLGNQEGDEAIQEIFEVTIPEVKEMVRNGEIKNGETLAALNLFFQKA